MIAIRSIPAWYWLTTLVFSAYYAYRGFVGNWFALLAANQARPESAKFPRWAIISVFSGGDALFHFACSVAGFVCLFVSNALFETWVNAASFDAGRSVFLVFVFLFGFVGAAGQLPQLILQGKIPGIRG